MNTPAPDVHLDLPAPAGSLELYTLLNAEECARFRQHCNQRFADAIYRHLHSMTDHRIKPEMNSITLVGRAAGDPEVRYYESGSVRAVFTLLVNRRGQAPDAFGLELWGKQAQSAADTVRKGALVGIIGELKRGYGDPIDEAQVYIRVDRLELLGKPQEVVA